MNAIKNAGLVTLGVLLSFFCAEMILHLFPSYSFEAMCSVEGRYSDRLWARGYRASKVTGYEHVPSLPGINSFGMRDKEYSLRKPENTYRMVLLGDSITEMGSWSDRVEEMLNNHGKYEILNCACNGWGLHEYWAYLKNKGIKFDPDMVIMGLCLNDIDGWWNVKTILQDKKTNITTLFGVNNEQENSIEKTLCSNPYLLRNSYLYRFLISIQIFRDRSHRDNENKIHGAPELLAGIKELSKGKVLAVIFPYLKPLDKYSKKEIRQYMVTKKELSNAGIEYLDLTNHFNAYGEKIIKFRDKPQDKIHFNKEANEIKAKLIYNWLKNQLN